MDYKKIIPYLNAENEFVENVFNLAEKYYFAGADELFIYNYSYDDNSKEEFLGLCTKISKTLDVPFIIGLTVKRFEDIKKALYTGASKVVVRYSKLEEAAVLEGIKRFGSDKVVIGLDFSKNQVTKESFEKVDSLGTKEVMLKHVDVSESLVSLLKESDKSIFVRDNLVRNDVSTLLSLPNVYGISTNYFENKNLGKAKRALKEKGINVNTFESSLSFSEFKLNNDGMIPVVVQDYKTNQVLMVAYMNEEAFNKTIEAGKMTYYSRSRNKLWLKGETSGHYQYVKELSIDCDNDTILAKVQQIGAACHTGNTSCFYTNLVKKEYDDTNPLTVFNEVFATIMDRKENPKEGSYTNYLFDKGIDKILKKCGEEATEIVIAAKNPNAEELKYEISDFLYHMMVLMAECGLDWKDVVKELAHRR